MVLSVQKPNIPGLGKQTFGSKRTNTSSTAAQTLSSGVRPNAFSFSNISKQRWVPGQNTIKGRMDANFQNARARLNRPYTPPPIDYSQVPTYNNATVGSNKAFAWGLGIAIGASVLGGLVSAAGGGRAGSAVQQLGQAVGSLGGTPTATTLSSGATSAMSSMTSASNSADLRQAILGAENQLNELSYVNNQETQTKYNTAKTTYDTAKGEVETGKKAVSEAEQGVSTTKQSIETLTTTRDTRKSALTNAMTKKNQCSSAYASAHADTIAAEAALANTPSQIPGPDGTMVDNPAHKIAQDKLTEAQDAENKAKASLDQATQDAIAADQEVKDAEQKLSAEQEKLTKQENLLQQKEAALDKAQQKLKDAEKKRDDAKAEMDKIDSDKKDYATLQSEITKQNERLTKLEQDEKNQFNNLSSKIDETAKGVEERASKIDTSDGMNLAEKVRQNKNEKDNVKIKEMTAQKEALADKVAITNLLASASDEVDANGNELRTGTLPSGKTVYFIGTREVNQAEFEAAKTTT